MTRIPTILFTALFILFLSSPSPAFYEYVDEHGVTRYTDDINEVPEDQRYGKEEYVEPEDIPPKSVSPKPTDATDGDAATPGDSDSTDKEFNYDETLKDLKERQQALMKEKEAIKKEDALLLQDKLNLKPGEDTEKYNDQALLLKQRTDELEERREEFNTKLNELKLLIQPL